jgi:YD repeat-containing protein
VTQTTFPSTLAETYVYDAVGNLTSKTDRKNQTIQYVYDALNRVTHEGYPDSTSVDYVYGSGRQNPASDRPEWHVWFRLRQHGTVDRHDHSVLVPPRARNFNAHTSLSTRTDGWSIR